MKKAEKPGIAQQVKEARHQKGLTQNALAEQSGLSLRSIQRIENGEVSPRVYSLNKLSEILDFSEFNNGKKEKSKQTVSAKRLILSIGSLIVMLLAAMAFLSQSRQFPENDFELQLYWILIVVLICMVQWFIWASRNRNQKD